MLQLRPLTLVPAPTPAVTESRFTIALLGLVAVASSAGSAGCAGSTPGPRFTGSAVATPRGRDHARRLRRDRRSDRELHSERRPPHHRTRAADRRRLLRGAAGAGAARSSRYRRRAAAGRPAVRVTGAGRRRRGP